MLTIDINLVQDVPVGGAMAIGYPAGKSRINYIAFGAELVVGTVNRYAYGSFTFTLGASSISVTNPTGRVIQAGTRVRLSLKIPAENAGSASVGQVARFVGYLEYPGSPIGNVTPDFVGQECQDTVADVFYKAIDTTAAGWKPITERPQTPDHPGGIWCDWQAATGTLAMVSTDAGDDVALDSTVTLDGLSAAKCTFSNAVSGTFIAEFSFTNAVSLKNFKSLQVPVRITGNDTTGGVISNTAPFQVWLYLSGGGTVRLQCDGANHPPGMWHVYSFSRESPAGMVTFAGGATAWSDLDSQTVTKVRLVQASVAASASYPIWVGPMRVNARAVGTVSFVLDGCYISQYTLMKPIFDAYGIKASLAVVNSFIGSGAAYMTLAQVDQMYDEGHECIHHTYDGTKQNGYANATDWTSAAAIADDIGQQWAYFRTQGWLRGIGFAVDAFSNPFAKTVSAARQALLKAAFSMAGVRCSRASTALYTTQMSLGYHGVKPFFLRGAIQVTSTDTAAAIKAVIDQAETNGEWAIITLHRAVASGAGSLETTTAILEEVCAYAAQRVAAGNLIVEPMGRAYIRHFVD